MTRNAIGALVAAGLLVLLSTVSVLAHAELVESDPADGDTIETPYTLTATFSEEFDPNPQRSFILVEDSAGEEVARGGVSDDDPTMMTLDLPELPPGEYLVRWQTRTLEDGGIENDTFTFNVAASATPSPRATPSPTATLAPATAPGTTPTPAPAASPLPVATPAPIDGQPTTGGSDVFLALVLAAVAIGAIALFLFARSRR